VRLATQAAFEQESGGTHGQEGIPTIEHFAHPGLGLAMLGMDILQTQRQQGPQRFGRPCSAWRMTEPASEHLSE